MDEMKPNPTESKVKLVQALVLLGVLVVTFVLFIVYKQNHHRIQSTSSQNTGQDYFLGGRVTKIEGNDIILETERVVTIGEKSASVKESKKVTTSASTKFVKFSKQGDKPVQLPAKLSDVRVGSQITVHSSQDVSKIVTITADQIDIQNY